jgi:hypothetical protein
MSLPEFSDIPGFFDQSFRVNGDLVGLVLGVEIPVVMLMLLVVCLRFYARTFVKRTLGADDWVMGLAAVSDVPNVFLVFCLDYLCVVFADGFVGLAVRDGADGAELCGHQIWCWPACMAYQLPGWWLFSVLYMHTG